MFIHVEVGSRDDLGIFSSRTGVTLMGLGYGILWWTAVSTRASKKSGMYRRRGHTSSMRLHPGAKKDASPLEDGDVVQRGYIFVLFHQGATLIDDVWPFRRHTSCTKVARKSRAVVRRCGSEGCWRMAGVRRKRVVRGGYTSGEVHERERACH